MVSIFNLCIIKKGWPTHHQKYLLHHKLSCWLDDLFLSSPPPPSYTWNFHQWYHLSLLSILPYIAKTYATKKVLPPDLESDIYIYSHYPQKKKTEKNGNITIQNAGEKTTKNNFPTSIPILFSLSIQPFRFTNFFRPRWGWKAPPWPFHLGVSGPFLGGMYMI